MTGAASTRGGDPAPMAQAPSPSSPPIGLGSKRPLQPARQLPTRGAPPISARTLQGMTFEPLDFLVGNILPIGLTILAGLPKVGKSWLALDIARSVALGIGCLGQPPQQRGAVLYLALEDNLRRLQARLADLLPKRSAWPGNLLFKTEWSRADESGISDLQSWLQQTPNARLIIIDVFQRFRSVTEPRGNSFQSDYLDLERLQKLAQAAKVGIILVHHLRKSSGKNDPFEQIAGSTGLTAAADTIIKLDRTNTGARLYARGKDIDMVDAPLEFDKASKCWRLGEVPDSVSAFPERDLIFDLLTRKAMPMAPKDIAQALGQSSSAIRTMLSRMHRRRDVIKHGRGLYSVVTNEGSPPLSSR